PAAWYPPGLGRHAPDAGAAALSRGNGRALVPFPSDLDFVQFQRGGMEQFFRSKQPGRQSLGVMTLEETGQNVAVRLQSVGPEILAHQRAGRAQLLLDEWQ